MKVTLLTPAYFPEVHRGGERVVRELAGQLAARGHETRIVAGHRGMPSVRDEGGVRVERVPRLLEGALRRRAYADHLAHLPAAAVALARGNVPDVVHAHYPGDAVVAGRWARRHRRPVVLSYHGIPSREVLASRRLALPIVTRAVAEADAIVVSSHAAAAAMRRWLGAESVVIHPPVDTGGFAGPVRRAVEPTIVCAADPDDDRKRVGLLVAAFRLVRREHPSARLRLLRPARADRLAELSGPGIELFDPVADPADLAPLYREAWVSALTAYNEAFGLVLAEALAAGTPVVGASDGGVPEVVDNPAIGRLFDGSRPEDVAQALLEALDLARHPATVVACRARAEAFSSRRFGDAHEALYGELAG